MTVTPFERSSSRIRTNRTRKSPTGVGFEHDHGPRYEFKTTDAGTRKQSPLGASGILHRTSPSKEFIGVSPVDPVAADR